MLTTFLKRKTKKISPSNNVVKELHQIVHQHWILRLGHCLRFSMVLFLGDAFKPKRSSSSWKSQTDILMATWGWNKILEACWVVEISSLSFCKRCSWIWWRFTQVSTMITKDIWQAKNSSGTNKFYSTFTCCTSWDDTNTVSTNLSWEHVFETWNPQEKSESTYIT